MNEQDFQNCRPELLKFKAEFEASRDELSRYRSALERIAKSKDTDGYHTRQATSLQKIAQDALEW